MVTARGYAATAPDQDLAPFSFERREPQAGDVQIEILYCGICHSDLHQARNDWQNSIYPMVPGHEIVGRVTAIGKDVKKVAVGDLVGVGCMVDSCHTCENCQDGLEQYCVEGPTWTYNATERDGSGRTQGGYSDVIVAREHFVVKVPENLDLKGVPPLLCAGITLYSPLRHWKAGPGKKVGIIGLGGLGHMGVKLAKAMGAHVVMITTSPEKGKDALRLGADEVLLSKDPEQLKKHAGSFHLLVDTIPNGHDLNPYCSLLKRDGTIVIVGALMALEPALYGGSLIGQRVSVAGSAIGGIAETQEMLDFCGQHNIISDVEMVNIQDVNQAYERLIKNDVRYRFVIDMESLKASSKS